MFLHSRFFGRSPFNCRLPALYVHWLILTPFCLIRQPFFIIFFQCRNFCGKKAKGRKLIVPPLVVKVHIGSCNPTPSRSGTAGCQCRSGIRRCICRWPCPAGRSGSLQFEAGTYSQQLDIVCVLVKKQIIVIENAKADGLV